MGRSFAAARPVRPPDRSRRRSRSPRRAGSGAGRSRRAARSAGRSPTRRRHRRRSSRRGRRSAHGPGARARRSSPGPIRSGSRRRPHSGAARQRAERGGRGRATAVTSVARCRTFGSSSTYGASGTCIPEQNGASAEATEGRRTRAPRGPCWSGPAPTPARGRRLAGAADGAGQNARGREARLLADQHLRGGTDQAVDLVGPAARVVRDQPRDQPAQIDVYSRGGDEIAGQDDLVQLPGTDPDDGIGDRGLPAGRSARRRRSDPRGARRPGHAADASSWRKCGPIRVIQPRPLRRPTMVSGTSRSRRCGVVGIEDEAAEGHEARPGGRVRQVADRDHLGDQVGPPGPRRGGARLVADDLAPGDHPSPSRSQAKASRAASRATVRGRRSRRFGRTAAAGRHRARSRGSG